MTSNTLSSDLRTAQDRLNDANAILRDALTTAQHIGLAAFRIASIQAALNYNQHAWDQLHDVATALELTGADHKL